VPNEAYRCDGGIPADHKSFLGGHSSCFQEIVWLYSSLLQDCAQGSLRRVAGVIGDRRVAIREEISWLPAA
jgi:hypothetical protein